MKKYFVINLLLIAMVKLSNVQATIEANIKPSRTECATPCTVVLSAEDTIAEGLDEHGVWSQLSYHWNFDTDESDTYGPLYNQNYTHVEGDTAFEFGHVPMVTKTFLCETGTCIYNVCLRAQNENGEYDDVHQTITVHSESVAWSAANTVCVSNTLDTADDWTVFDKACPAGATKQNITLDRDNYDGKLVLFKKGDVFSQNIGTDIEQSNFKLGVFGNDNEARPEIDGEVEVGFTNFGGPPHAPTAANYINISDQDTVNGWPENIYVESLKIGAFSFPMSYQHIGLHNIDMDREAYDSGGRIDVSASATICHLDSDLSCDNVPFPKGGYISSVDVIGGGTNGPGVNLVQTQCPMVNFLGITNTRIRRAFEHNIRIAGWYRTNIMRSFIRGEHLQPVSNGKNSKITLRSCNRSGGDWEAGVWFTDPNRPLGWDDDVMNLDGTMRTRADANSTATDPNLLGFGEFFHISRYQVVAHNKIGDSSIVTPEPEGVPYITNVQLSFPLDFQGQQDIMLSHNTFERQNGEEGGSAASVISTWPTCVDNFFPSGLVMECTPNANTAPPEMEGYRNNPVPTPVPLPPICEIVTDIIFSNSFE